MYVIIAHEQLLSLAVLKICLTSPLSLLCIKINLTFLALNFAFVCFTVHQDIRSVIHIPLILGPAPRAAVSYTVHSLAETH